MNLPRIRPNHVLHQITMKPRGHVHSLHRKRGNDMTSQIIACISLMPNRLSLRLMRSLSSLYMSTGKTVCPSPFFFSDFLDDRGKVKSLLQNNKMFFQFPQQNFRRSQYSLNDRISSTVLFRILPMRVCSSTHQTSVVLSTIRW